MSLQYWVAAVLIDIFLLSSLVLYFRWETGFIAIIVFYDQGRPPFSLDSRRVAISTVMPVLKMVTIYSVPSFCFLFFLNWFRSSCPRIRLWSLNVYNCGFFCFCFFFSMYNRYSLILCQANITCIINNLHVNCHTSPSFSGSFKF